MTCRVQVRQEPTTTGHEPSFQFEDGLPVPDGYCYCRRCQRLFTGPEFMASPLCNPRGTRLLVCRWCPEHVAVPMENVALVEAFGVVCPSCYARELEGLRVLS